MPRPPKPAHVEDSGENGNDSPLIAVASASSQSNRYVGMGGGRIMSRL